MKNRFFRKLKNIKATSLQYFEISFEMLFSSDQVYVSQTFNCMSISSITICVSASSYETKTFCHAVLI